MRRPVSRTLPALLMEQARATPDRLAVRSRLGDRTYGDLAQRAAHVAAALRRQGVGAGDTLALMAPNLPQWLDVAFGALTCGARVAAFNTWAKAWDLQYLLGHSEASTLIMVGNVGRNDLLGELETLLPEAWNEPAGQWSSSRFPALRTLVVIGTEPPQGGLAFEQFLADASGTDDGASPEQDADPNAPAFILYTSGSTAAPKAVPLVHSAMIENGFNIGERMGLTETDRVWLASPLFWSFGVANALMATFGHGATLVLQPGFDVEESIRLIEEEGCTAGYLMPTMADALARHGADRIRRAGTLRTGVMIGRPSEIQRVAVELGVSDICNIYGSTETYGNCCVTPYDLPLEVRMFSQGPPLPGMELRIVGSETGEPCPAGEEGEIWVHGYITPGYVGDEDATRKAITADGWYRSGDVGFLDAQGLLHYTGRATEMIKSNGINVSPVEIENFVITHPAVAEVVVVGTPHPIKEEIAVAFVRLKPQQDATADAIIAFCRQSIAGYKVPAAVTIVDEIPKTGTGKVSRRLLKDDAAAAIRIAASELAP